MKTTHMTRPLTAALALLGLCAPLAHAQTALDVGSNYTTPTWINGSNGGSGFAAWDIGGSGHFIGTAAPLGSGADIGTTFAFSETSSGYANRAFAAGVLPDGYSFSADLTVNFRDGYRGISIKNGGTDIAALTISADDYQFGVVGSFGQTDISALSGASGDWSYASNTVLSLTATRIGSDLQIDIERSGGLAGSYSTTLSGSGVFFNGFSLYSFTTSGLSQNQIHFNNLTVVPEPGSAAALAAVIALGAVVAFSRLKRTA